MEGEDRKEKMYIHQDSAALANSWSVLQEVSGRESWATGEHRLGPQSASAKSR